MNEHSDQETEVLALELGFVADEGIQLLIPSVYGEEAVRAKAVPRRKWDEDAFFEALRSKTSEAGLVAVRRLYETAEEVFRDGGGEFRWGTGPNPSVTAAFKIGDRAIATWTVVIWGHGSPIMAPQFIHLREAVDRGALAAFADRVAAIPGFRRIEGLTAADFNRKPEIDVEDLAARDALGTFMQALSDLLSSGAAASRE